MKSYKLFIEQQNAFTVGLFPGAFKPPHKGHYETAKRMALENQAAVLLMPGETREGITPEKALQTWKIYKKTLPKNLFVFIVAGSPVTAIYQIVNILNNGEYVPTSDKVLAPLPEALDIATHLKNNTPPYKIRLYASAEDMKRYAAFFNAKTSKFYLHKQVTEIKQKPVSRLASATVARKAIAEKNKDEFLSLLPEISSADKQNIVRLFI